MRTRSLSLRIAAPLLALAVASCASHSPDTYSPGAMQQASKVDRGTIESARTVDVKDNPLGSGIGAGAGAAAGGIAGAQIGSGGGNAAATLLGVLVGGLIGAMSEHAVTDSTATEYIVRKENGDLVSVTQQDQAPLAIGLKVLVIYGVQARIIPADAAAAALRQPTP